MSSLFKNGLILLGIFALLGIGYFLYVKKDEVVLQNTEVTPQENAGAEQFLRKLSNLEAIDLEVVLFEDERFTSLINMTPEVIPVPIGQENPFAKN
ncbi:MAG: hypothetical protein ACI92I_000303 [Acidimicrobiales bacterium]|jgi:hypothetical protein